MGRRGALCVALMSPEINQLQSLTNAGFGEGKLTLKDQPRPPSTRLKHVLVGLLDDADDILKVI